LVAEYAQTDPVKRKKRGVLDFVGEISKILFGTLTQSDAREYNSHISQLEQEQQEFLHISSEQMTVIKSTINSVNSTMRRVDENERVLRDGLLKLDTKFSNVTLQLQQEIELVSTANTQIGIVERGIFECQHGFEILVDALIHAAQGIFQPQFVTAEKIKQAVLTQKLPPGVDYPSLPFSELQHIIVPHAYMHNQFLVYVLDIPLLSSTTYYLYKMLPFPSLRQENVFAFIHPSKDYIVMDSLKRQFCKLSSEELSKCSQINIMHHVCKQDIPIVTYIPGSDCESTLLHPSSQSIPPSCEVRIIKLTSTYWIPLFLSNEWLFVSPRPEKLSVICDDITKQVEIQQRGKLILNQQCKAYTAYVTLYALSIPTVNISHDFVPAIPIDFDCCFIFEKTNAFEDIPLTVPLSNILTSTDDLRLASHKVDEVEQMIKEQEIKDYSKWYAHVTAWSSIVSFIVFTVFSSCCCCCCCKGYRLFWFRIWDRWTPTDCWRETGEKLCVNITNVQGRQPAVHYHKPSQSPRPSPSPTRLSLTEPNVLNDDEVEELHYPVPALRRSLRSYGKNFR
jgi:hypothetical protein